MIRKIVIGVNPKDAMAYYIGMNAGDGKIVAIEKNFNDFGEPVVLIFIQTDQGTSVWKEVFSMPMIIEYDCKF
jgi:hypothetical protein